jgi:hypothetical protein
MSVVSKYIAIAMENKKLPAKIEVPLLDKSLNIFYNFKITGSIQAK